MNYLNRAHEWLADNVSFVQYPKIRRVMPLRPKEPVTLVGAAGRLLLGLAALAVGAFGLWCVGAGLFVFYVVMKGLFF